VLADGDESVTTFGNQPVSGNLLSNALPPSGATASVASFLLPGSSTSITAGSGPANITDPISGVITGTLDVQPSGAFTFVPSPGYGGPVPAVTYTVSSSDGKTDTSVLSISINPALADGDEVRSTRAGTPVTLNLLDNAVAPTGTTTSIASFTLPGSAAVYNPGSTAVPVINPATGSATGTIVVLADGTATFTPAPGFSGTVPTVSYVVRSSDGQTDPSTLIITVVPGVCVHGCGRGERGSHSGIVRCLYVSIVWCKWSSARCPLKRHAGCDGGVPATLLASLLLQRACWPTATSL
jgi:hypothetical protein